jgi:hypothetical protein
LKTPYKLLKKIALPHETDKEKPYLRNTLHTFSNREKRERKTNKKMEDQYQEISVEVKN